MLPCGYTRAWLLKLRTCGLRSIKRLNSEIYHNPKPNDFGNERQNVSFADNAALRYPSAIVSPRDKSFCSH